MLDLVAQNLDHVSSALYLFLTSAKRIYAPKRLSCLVLCQPVLLTLAGCGAPLASSALKRAAATVATQSANGARATWQAYAGAPTARADAGGVAIGFQLYVVGGTTDQGGALSNVETFTAFDHWAASSAVPTARTGVAVTDVPSARVLAVGGEANGQALASAEYFGTEQQAWVTLNNMPTARSAPVRPRTVYLLTLPEDGPVPT